MPYAAVLVVLVVVGGAGIAVLRLWPRTVPHPAQVAAIAFLEPGADHRTQSKLPGDRYGVESFVGGLPVERQANSTPLYLCRVNDDSFSSLRPDCEGYRLEEQLGYIFSRPPAGLPSRPVYRCFLAFSGEHFDSLDPTCEGQVRDLFLGYVLSDIPLLRFYNASTTDHLTDVGPAAPGYQFESTLGFLLAEPASGTTAVYRCRFAGDRFTSTDEHCEGKWIGERLGYIYVEPPSGTPTTPIYRCTMTANGEHFDSTSSSCEGQTSDRFLGYAITASQPPRAAG